MLNEMDRTDQDSHLYWAAGYLSAQGTFTAAGGTVRLTITSSRDHSSVHRLAQIMGSNVTLRERGKVTEAMLTCSGDKLHRFMRTLWPQLSRKRQHDYAWAREKARKINEKNDARTTKLIGEMNEEIRLRLGR